MPDDAVSMECFGTEDSDKVNLISILGGDLALRHTIQVWDMSPSELDDCVTLSNPRQPQPLMQIADASFPILGLLDALTAAEFIGVPRPVTHAPMSGFFYDSGCSRNRAYLKCVLASKWLFQNGQRKFASGQSAAYYQLLLKSPGKVTAGRPAREYLLALADAADTTVVPKMVVDIQPPRKRKIDDTIDGDDGGDILPLPLEDDKVDEDEEDSGTSSDSSSGKSTSSSGDSSSGGDGSIDGDEPDIPTEIFGCKIRRERKHDGSMGYRITCPEHGFTCRRFRSHMKQVEQFGPLGPIFFLGAWAKLAPGKAHDKHRAYSPTRAEMRDFIEKEMR